MDGPLESSTNPMMQPRECVTPPPNLSLQGKLLGLTSIFFKASVFCHKSNDQTLSTKYLVHSCDLTEVKN